MNMIFTNEDGISMTKFQEVKESAGGSMGSMKVVDMRTCREVCASQASAHNGCLVYTRGTEGPDRECPIQAAFSRLAKFEKIGMEPEELFRFVRDKEDDRR